MVQKMTLSLGVYPFVLTAATRCSTKLHWTVVPGPALIQATLEMKSADIRPRLWSSVSLTASHCLINCDSCLESRRVDVRLC